MLFQQVSSLFSLQRRKAALPSPTIRPQSGHISSVESIGSPTVGAKNPVLMNRKVGQENFHISEYSLVLVSLTIGSFFSFVSFSFLFFFFFFFFFLRFLEIFQF